MTGLWKDVLEVGSCCRRCCFKLVFVAFDVYGRAIEIFVGWLSGFFDPGVGEFVMYASFLYGGPVEGRLYMYILYSLLFLVQGGPVEGRLSIEELFVWIYVTDGNQPF